MDFSKELVSVKKASEYLVTELRTRGILEEQEVLEFVSVDYKSLMDFKISGYEEDELKKIKKHAILNEKLITNDKNVINTIHTLIRNLDRTRDQRIELEDDGIRKERELLETQQRVKELEQEIQRHKKKLDEKDFLIDEVQRHRGELYKQVEELQEKVMKTERINHGMRQSFDIELRKKDVEISEIKDKLLLKKYGKSAVVQFPRPESENAWVKSVDTEIETLMVDTADTLAKLALTNGENLKILEIVAQYLELLTGNIDNLESDLKLQSLLDPLSFFKDKFTEPTQLNEDLTTYKVTDTINKLSDTKKIQNQVVQNFTELFRQITTMQKPKDADVEKLESELRDAKQNWQDAVDTLEEWKRYKGE